MGITACAARRIADVERVGLNASNPATASTTPARVESARVDAPAKRIDVSLTKDAIEHGPSIDTADIELVETLPPFLIF